MISLFFVFLTTVTFACRPSVNFRSPPLSQIKAESDLILVGVIEKNSGEGLERELSVKVERVIKGKGEAKISVKAGASSCDRLGYDAVVGTRCLLYIKDGRTFSGLFGGNASRCPWDERAP